MILICFEMNKFIWFIFPTIIISKTFLSQFLAEATDTLFHISWDYAALKPFITETFFFLRITMKRNNIAMCMCVCCDFPRCLRSVMSKCVTILTRVVGDLWRNISKTAISFFLSLSSSLSLFGSMLKSHSLVKFSELFSGPDGRFLLVGCDRYITPLMTRTSSCFLQPCLKVDLSGGGALQHPVLCIQCASETHIHAVSCSLSLSLSSILSMSLTLSHSTG